MTILSTISSFQAPLTLLLVIFGPTLLPRLIAFIRRRPSSTPKPPRVATPVSLKLFLAIHTLWMTKQLISPPFDLFSHQNLPISTSNSNIRLELIGTISEDNSNIHPLVELLLTKLKVMDNRINYVRYGHKSLIECVWCNNPIDYLLYSTPNILSWYFLEAVYLGMMGWTKISGKESDKRTERWRGTFGWSLLVAAILEIGLKWLWDIRVVEGNCIHLSSVIHTVRSIYLLLLPIIYSFLPLPSSNLSPQTFIPMISNTTSTLRLTSLARAAIHRSPRLRETRSSLGRREAERAEIIRRDEEVRRTVKDSGLDEVNMREGAERWVRDGWDGMIRVDPAGQR
ncbi:uncharacterized protein IL334_002030 [Kwoniella shivajii]|uniref:Uncharacterized protein n=1 Tax=Kwoniella shivajii TaxID=564305 RepID=A0ABZ1CTS2_9TREE|nr:hypothetical protein IL334_002030 [Kwoniella shivajii]